MNALKRFHIHVLQGILPVHTQRVPGDVLAGVTLAALGVPEVLGYAKIAGTPVVTGLYTILLPIAIFALFGSSRHLVVGADSATAAILAAGVTGLAAYGSPRYVGLASLSALTAGGLLLLARLVRLGFLANFLSRTVLIGFLTGVGIQVAAGQLAEILGLHGVKGGTVQKLIDTVRQLSHISILTLVISLVVIAIILGMGRVTKRVPGALIAVVGAVIVSRFADLAGHGVTILGAVPQGLPHLGLPDASLSDVPKMAATAISMFVVILAQSAATSRAYAARYDEEFSENTDLVGLGLANIAAGLSSTFVVNGSPTKTEMVDSAGGESQLSQLTTAVVVLVVLLFLTGPLRYLPTAVLAAVVFLIGLELIQIQQMRTIFRLRRDEFVIALLTAAAVVFIGVEQGIILAIVLSVIDHLRYSYNPRNTIVVPVDATHWRSERVQPGERTAPGLVVYRFGSSLYYANAHSLAEDVTMLLDDQQPLHWFCLDAAAIGDVDYSAAQVLERIHHEMTERHVRFCLSDVSRYVLAELQRYGIAASVGQDAIYSTPADVLHAYGERGQQK